VRIYLGGKMLGVPGYGFAEFDAYAEKLRAQGHEVFNPADHDRDNGFDPPAGSDGTAAEMTGSGFNRREAIAADLAWITEKSEGMVVLINWADSPGCRAEVAAHQALYLPVWPVDEFLRVGTKAEPLEPLMPSLPFLTLADTIVIGDVLAECVRSIEIHGPQSLPDGTSRIYTSKADKARFSCQAAFASGRGTHRHIVMEEFYEALSETEWSKLRPELIQTMATIHKWIKDGDARDNRSS
jgi:hypothetical protein